MKVLFFTIGDSNIASSRARVYEFIPYLAQIGVESQIIPLVRYEEGEGETKNRWVRYSRSLKRIFAVLKKTSFFDIIFIQRLILPYWIHLFLKKKSKKMVYDLDDAVYLTLNGYKKELFYKRIQSYNGVISANRFLEEAMKPYVQKIISIPTCVNTKRLFPNPTKMRSGESKVRIGWIGTPHSEKYLFSMESIFEQLNCHYALEFHLISDGNSIFSKIPVKAKKWSLNTEVADLQEMDIGVMPLSDGSWEKMKSGYKILQYMAVGIPVVAAGVGINPDLIQHGVNGFIANHSEEWIRYLSLLIESPSKREEIGMSGRKFVEENYDHQVQFERLYQFLLSV